MFFLNDEKGILSIVIVLQDAAQPGLAFPMIGSRPGPGKRTFHRCGPVPSLNTLGFTKNRIRAKDYGRVVFLDRYQLVGVILHCPLHLSRIDLYQRQRGSRSSQVRQRVERRPGPCRRELIRVTPSIPSRGATGKACGLQ